MEAIILPILFAGVILIILSSGLCYYIVQRTKSKPWDSPDSKTLEKRLSSLEKRLTDIQDIVISIDDQLKRESSLPVEE